MLAILEQLSFELPDPASPELERLLAEELAREVGEELPDAA